MLWLLPNLFAEDQDLDHWFVPKMNEIVGEIDGIIAESDKSARLFLKRFGAKKPPHLMPVALWNKNTPKDQVDFFLEPMAKKKETWALISDAGVPCVADPGSQLVLRARQRNISVHTVSGPSSLLLALQLSGLPAQRFAFDGYLPRDEKKRKEVIKHLEKRSGQEQSTQMVMDTPYRNLAAFKALVETLEPETTLCVASNLALPNEWIKTAKIKEWRKLSEPPIQKEPTLFLFLKK